VPQNLFQWRVVQAALSFLLQLPGNSLDIGLIFSFVNAHTPNVETPYILCGAVLALVTRG
jgi:hypothetical protein